MSLTLVAMNSSFSASLYQQILDICTVLTNQIILEVNHGSWVGGQGMHKCFSGERSKRINVKSESWVMDGEGGEE